MYTQNAEGEGLQAGALRFHGPARARDADARPRAPQLPGRPQRRTPPEPLHPLPPETIAVLTVCESDFGSDSRSSTSLVPSTAYSPRHPKPWIPNLNPKHRTRNSQPESTTCAPPPPRISLGSDRAGIMLAVEELMSSSRLLQSGGCVHDRRSCGVLLGWGFGRGGFPVVPASHCPLHQTTQQS